MTVKSVLRYGVIGGVFLLPLIALVVSNTTFFPFIVGKNITFRVLVELVLIGWITLAFVDPAYRPRRSWLSLAVVVFVLVVGVADLFGVNPTQSFWSNFERMEGFVTVLHLLGFFVVASSVLASERLWSWFFHISIGVSVLAGLMTLAGSSSALAGGPLGNAIYLAIYMLFNAFLAGFYLLRTWGKNVYISVGYALIIIFNISIMFLTETRGTALGFFASIGVMVLLLVIFERSKPGVRKTALAVFVAGVVVAGIFTTALIMNNSGAGQGSNGFTRAVNATPFIGTLATIDLTSVNSATTRFYIWRMALEGATERPLLGWGQDNFNYVFNKHYNPLLHSRESWFDRAHNTFLDWLAAAGIVGLLSYVSLYVLLLYVAWKDPEENWSFYEKVVLTGLIVAYAVHNLFVFDSITSYLMFFAVMAYVTARTSGEKKRVLEDSPAVPKGLGYGVGVPVIVVLIAGSLYMTAYKPWTASRDLINALRYANSQAGLYEQGLGWFQQALAHAQNSVGTQEIREQLALKAVDVARENPNPEVVQRYGKFANEQMAQHTSRFPGETRPLVFWGQMLSKTGNLDAAEDALLKALENSPRKQGIMFQLVSVYINQERYDEAVEIAQRAFELAPSFFQARIMYASALRYADNEEKVQEILEPVENQAIFEDMLLRPYLDKKEYQSVIDVRRERIDVLHNRLEDGSGGSSTMQQIVQERASIAAVYEEIGRSDLAIQELREIKNEFPQFAAQIDDFIEQIRSGEDVF